MIRRAVSRLLSIFAAAGSLLLLAPAFAQAPAAGAGLTVFAAASLKESLDENLKLFSARTGVAARVSYAGSNALAKQIESGAPANVFISADEVWMDYLRDRKLVVPGSIRVLVGNELVLIAPANSKAQIAVAPGFPLAAALAGGRLSVANPDAVPAGLYAKTALTKLNVWSTVEGSLARAENVRAALAFVARAETPFGIVYRTDAMAEPKVRVVAAFPKDSHAPIVYPAALVQGNDSKDAQALLDYLSSDAARSVWQKYGFTVSK